MIADYKISCLQKTFLSKGIKGCRNCGAKMLLPVEERRKVDETTLIKQTAQPCFQIKGEDRMAAFDRYFLVMLWRASINLFRFSFPHIMKISQTCVARMIHLFRLMMEIRDFPLHRQNIKSSLGNFSLRHVTQLKLQRCFTSIFLS